MSNNITETLLQPLESSSGISNNLFSSTNANAESSDSFFGFFQNITMTTWIIIILVLTLLGFNIFSYLDQGSQKINNIFQPIINSVINFIASITGQVVDISAQGAKDVVNVTADTLDTTLSSIQNAAEGNPPQSTVPSFSSNLSVSSNKGTSVQSTIPTPDIAQANTLNQVLNSAKVQNVGSQIDNDYQADEAGSSIQSGNANKAGWCYIGEERGYRSCAEVGVNDMCMSGDIFPSQEICINPSLRP